MRNASTILQALASLALLTSLSSAELLVHYTFDDLNGSTVLDSAAPGGNNNATIVANVGTSIPGVLGDAIRLPNDDGVSYVRLPSSLNPAPNGNDERTIAFFFNQEEVGAENKMFGYGTGQQGRSFDVSLEGGGIRLRYSGGNVTWGSGFDFTGVDAGFHHLAIRVPGGAFDYLDIEVLLNGEQLPGVATGGNPGSTFINTGGGVATNLDLGRSPVFSPAGDFIGLMDDFRIYDHALTDAEIRALIPDEPTLTLEVDPVTGFTAIRNHSDETISLDYYEIESTTPMLNAAGWSELETQSRVNFPAGSGTGDGWEVLGTANAFSLVEAFLQGESSLAPGEWLNLGQA
ncbi:MAG: LamG-like jellyroll fold domain-containing protein, partial [Lacipirellulaceae bacterium]